MGKNIDRDCENCKHYVNNRSCEVWDCEYEPITGKAKDKSCEGCRKAKKWKRRYKTLTESMGNLADAIEYDDNGFWERDMIVNYIRNTINETK